MIPTYDFLTRLCERSASAVIGQSGFRDPALNRNLRAQLSAAPGTPGSFLADPVLEGAFGFRQAAETMNELGSLLSPELIAALDSPRVEIERGGEPYRFGGDWRPYAHQLDAWRTLLAPEPRSVLVSSGTGSGKTECFLIPILQDLLAERRRAGRLRGVRALMLYPLNALINSQRDRLFDWTSSFGNDLRFCLYNGGTPEEARAAAGRLKPNEVTDRTALRDDTPPILVTNITMLEYMLIRHVDAPILEASRGKLRWIVLDEAHSYIGSQAAELALLLRRVLRGFGVAPGEVRFVATSATLGEAPDVDEKLREFLHALSGMPRDRIHLVKGGRDVPALESFRRGDGAADLDDEAFERLIADPAAIRLRSELARGAPLTLSSAARTVFNDPEKRGDAMALAERATRGRRGGRRFLPLRLHMVHRAQAGFWTCVNVCCGGRAESGLDGPDWPWVATSIFERERCIHCDGPMFELASCGDCGAANVIAEESADGSVIRCPTRLPAEDEFSQGLVDADPSEDEEAQEQGRHVTIGFGPFADTELVLDPASGKKADTMRDGFLRLKFRRGQRCCCCETSESPRRARFGAPFLLGAATPQLLERVDPKSDMPPEADATPVRQLITFTDSRQGTARFSARLQQDSERGLVRAALYHAVQNGAAGDLADEIAAKRKLIASLEALGESAADIIRGEKENLSALIRKADTGLSFKAAVRALANEPDLERLRVESWAHRDSLFSDAEGLARTLLLREIFRRPRRANSAETMGLVGLRLRAVEDLQDKRLPQPFRARGLDMDAWRSFLYAAELAIFRANGAVAISRDERRWMSARGYAREVRKDKPEFESRSVIVWPSVGASKGPTSRLVRMLVAGLGLDLARADHADQARECLDRAWEELIPSLQSTTGGGYQLNVETFVFGRVEAAWLCPLTRQVLASTFCGLTPWQPLGATTFKDPCEPIVMPRLQRAYPRAPAEQEAMAEWLETDAAVRTMRDKGVWSDLHDRVALFPPAILTAEHSAQQPGWRLKLYEKRFKLGRINILNCSTTMEMGVDIGGLQAVVNTNVPPSPASYRQRVGRAGRRGEAMALALTFARDEPFGWTTYEQPDRPLTAAIQPPRVSLDSAVIVQRHANALLLSAFLAEGAGAELHRLTVGAFFGRNAEGQRIEQDPSQRFLTFCEAASGLSERLAEDLRRLLAGTRLERVKRVELQTADMLRRVIEAWRNECDSLAAELTAAQSAAAKNAIRRQIKRICESYLLGELSQRGFLPAYGFPTDVVAFIVPAEADGARKQEIEGPDENAFRRLDAPTRSLDRAIRDYAPGAEVVIDGLVYRSAGVSLNWKRPAGSNERAPQSIRWGWRCKSCDASGDAPSRPDMCAACSSDELTRVEYIRPAGFVFDDQDEKPHTDVTQVDYIEPLPPFVSADGADWTTLTNSELGRMRSAREGVILFRAAGRSGNGYALCLHCGRAAEDSSPIAGGAFGKLPWQMEDHRSLRGRAGALICTGATSEFGVKRNLRLGHAARTDVFELQLEALQSPKRENQAVTLAVALREALARELGIESSELGYRAESRRFSEQRQGWSILLFDLASGGAGFASQAANITTPLLRRAREILDCDSQGCRTACPSCLLMADSRFDAAKLDRIAALELLDQEILVGLVLPLRLRAFGERTSAEMRPPVDAIDARLSGSAPLTLFFDGDAPDYDPSAWPGLRLIERAVGHGAPVRFVLPSAALRALTLAQRLALRALLMRDGVTLHEASEAPKIGQAQLFATVGDGGEVNAFAVTQPDAVRLSETWGRFERTVLLSGRMTALPLGRPIDPAGLEPPVGEDARRISVHQELDGPIKTFGTRFWTLLKKGFPEFADALRRGAPKRAVYDDRYLKSPLPAMLLGSVLKALPCGLQGTGLTIRTLDDDDISRTPRLVSHDWPDARRRKATITEFLAASGAPGTVVLGSRRVIPHDRCLLLEWASGTAVRINLDKGFGAWSTAVATTFDFTADHRSQADSMASLDEIKISGDPTLLYMTCRRA